MISSRFACVISYSVLLFWLQGRMEGGGSETPFDSKIIKITYFNKYRIINILAVNTHHAGMFKN